MKNTLPFILFLTTLYGCHDHRNNHPKVNEINTTQNASDSIVDDATSQGLMITDSSKSLEKNRLSILKKVVRAASEEKTLDALTITNNETIKSFQYIKNMFSYAALDSIEFYGVFGESYKNPKHQPLNTLLILYFNNERLAKQELDSLDINWEKNFDATESMFKAGGMAFELDHQLCIYSVNICGLGNKNLLRIDSVISNEVFDNKSFNRLHARCGMGSFTKIRK